MSTKIKFTIKNYFNSHALLFEKMDITKINTALELLKSKYLAGNKIITCGNGGSALHYIPLYYRLE